MSEIMLTWFKSLSLPMQHFVLGGLLLAVVITDLVLVFSVLLSTWMNLVKAIGTYARWKEQRKDLA